MIERISLRNFQSWEKLDLDLAPVTMIVGRGNTGKSAIIRAVTYALTNQGGDAFIRNDAKEARVLIGFDDGTALLWSKPRGKGAVYNVLLPSREEREYTKTGQTTPPEILDLLGIRPVEIDKNLTLWPQLSQQFDPPFIIGESGSRIARILGKFTRLDVLVQAQILARRDVADARRQAQAAEESAAHYKSQLDKLPNVDELKDRYDRVRKQYERVRELTGIATQIEAAIQTYRDAEAAAQAGDPGDLAERASVLAGHFEHIGRAENALANLSRTVASLADRGVAVDEASEHLAQLKQEYENLCQAQGICETCPWK